MGRQNDFAMDYEALYELAKQIHQMETDFAEMRKNLDTLVSSLDDQWQGKAQVEFATAYGKLQPKLNTISETLYNYATAISKAASGEQDLESFHTTLFNPIYPSF